MQAITIAQAQADMREGYLDGAPGVLCSAGLAFARARVPVPVAALAGGVIEVVFAALLFGRAARRG